MERSEDHEDFGSSQYRLIIIKITKLIIEIIIIMRTIMRLTLLLITVTKADEFNFHR